MQALGIIIWLLGWIMVWDQMGPDALLAVLLIWFGRGMTAIEERRPA